MEPGANLLHYRLVDKIGEGGMGEVWKAQDTTLDREVAIKILPEALVADPERRARFEREAKTLAALNHPNIATIHGLHAEGERVFLAMELVDGEDLAKRLTRGPLPVETGLAVARQVADALDAAHEQGIVHRDLKPANVVLAADGSVKVLDFGLAKILGPESGDRAGDPSASPTVTSLGTRAGMILGTAAYMSPEQARGHAVDRRADLWALGVMIHEMLTGTQPFLGGTVSDTLAAVLRAEVDFDALPAETPPEVRRVLRRCLERDPARRLRDVAEVRFAIDEPDDGGQPPPVVAAGRSRVLTWVAPAVAVALLLGWLAGAFLARTPPPGNGILRATIPPPDGGHFFLSSRQPGPAVLSPDGSRIAFVARDADRQIALWVRALDADSATRLEGTEGASYPFWSSDSRDLGFFADRKLKRVPAVGGAVLNLCEAPFGKGGSWNSSGQIVFAPSYNSPIHVVSEDGGASTQLTTLDDEAAEHSHRFPFFLPDGKHFLYLARLPDSSGPAGQIRIATVQGDDAGVLVDSSAQAIYRAGHLLYVKDNVLLARSFNADTRSFTGQPVVVAADVDIIAGAARGVFSASEDGKLIYMTEDRGEGHGIVWLDRNGERVPDLAGYGIMYDVSVSPEGTRFAANLNDDLWVFDLRRGTRQRVTFGQESVRSPIWMPDGKTLVYRARGERFMDLYAKAADGSGEPRLLVTSDVNKINNDVSPDGRFVVYTANDRERRFDLWVLPLEDGAEPYAFLTTDFDEEHARFSPDGRFLAYQSNATGVDEIFIISFPDKNLRAQVSTRGGLSPRWSDDGTELYFHSPRDEVMAVPVALSDDRIEVGPAESLFFLTTPAYGNYDVSGDRFLVETAYEGGDRPSLRLVLDWPALAE